MILFIAASLFLLAIALYLFEKTNKKIGLDSYFISTESQSNERVKNLNLDQPSEDSSHILDSTKLMFHEVKQEPVEYKADPKREFIVDLIAAEGGSFYKKDLVKMFDYEWRTRFSSTIFGFSNKDNAWTYVNAGDAPEVFNKIQVAIPLHEAYDENTNYDRKKLESYIAELEMRAKNYPIKLTIKPQEKVEDAVVKAKKLKELFEEFNYEAAIVLQSAKTFNGMQAWDALQSVGLQWGDGDLFHWNNSSDYGHDQHFSVSTSTSPGYFFPEEIKNGNMKPQNLVFSFSVPRSADPENVFDIMVNAAKYCQKRLGGQLLDIYGQPFDMQRSKAQITELVKGMEAKGIKPGSNEALITF